MKVIIDQIKEEASEVFDTLIKIRRHLHQYPELSFQEENTGKFISDTLTQWGVSHTKGWAGNGIVAELGDSKEIENVIFLRADIDALPIQEVKDRSYHSTIENRMHACGHDVHTTCVLGAIHILKNLQDQWKGRIRFMFQPGEEKLPGGASIMIDEGVLDNPKPKYVIGQHVHPPLEVGNVGFHPGPYMASADELYITITGKGGHAALPANCINPITVSSQVIAQFEQLYKKYKEENHEVILSLGKIWSDGGATNIIPERLHIEGTYRAMNEKIRSKMHAEMQEIISKIQSETKSKIDFEIRRGYPVLINHVQATEKCMDFAREFVGVEQTIHLPKRMTSEDFSYYSQKVPSVFYRLGTGNKAKGITASVHTPQFDVDEDSIELGAGLMAYLAIGLLEN